MCALVPTAKSDPTLFIHCTYFIPIGKAPTAKYILIRIFIIILFGQSTSERFTFARNDDVVIRGGNHAIGHEARLMLKCRVRKYVNNVNVYIGSTLRLLHAMHASNSSCLNDELDTRHTVDAFPPVHCAFVRTCYRFHTQPKSLFFVKL